MRCSIRNDSSHYADVCPSLGTQSVYLPVKKAKMANTSATLFCIGCGGNHDIGDCPDSSLKIGDNKEMVNHPDHYGGGDNPHEVIKVIDAWGWTEHFCLASSVKYLARAQHKGKKLEDLKKSCWYINHLIEHLEKEQCQS